MYYEGPLEHESVPPHVNIVIQHCGVDGLFIRAFNAPVRTPPPSPQQPLRCSTCKSRSPFEDADSEAICCFCIRQRDVFLSQVDGPVRARLEDSVYLGADTMTALFADFSELLASASNEQAADLESSALLLANPASSFLFYAAREGVAGALRVLTLNRSVFDYDLVDEADGLAYRLEVFVEEGSLRIEAQCLSDDVPTRSSGRHTLTDSCVYSCRFVFTGWVGSLLALAFAVCGV